MSTVKTPREKQCVQNPLALLNPQIVRMLPNFGLFSCTGCWEPEPPLSKIAKCKVTKMVRLQLPSPAPNLSAPTSVKQVRGSIPRDTLECARELYCRLTAGTPSSGTKTSQTVDSPNTPLPPVTATNVLRQEMTDDDEDFERDNPPDPRFMMQYRELMDAAMETSHHTGLPPDLTDLKAFCVRWHASQA